MRSTCRSFALAALALLVAVPALAKPLIFTTPEGAEFACRFKPGLKPALLDCRQDVTPAPTPAPTPTPTPEPEPEPVACDAWFVRGPEPRMLFFGHYYQPGVPMVACADVPQGTALFLRVGSTPWSHGSCNVYAGRAISPSGVEYELGPGTQPGKMPFFESGVWAVELTLDPNPDTLCRENKRLDVWLTW